jgi:DNA-binding MarR family transcriptional regulator
MGQVVEMLRGGSLLHLLVRDMTTEMDRRFASFDLTTQQAALLSAAASGGSTPGELRQAVGTDTAGMTKLLDRLEGKGLVSRRPNPTDRRSVLVEPTRRGLALVPDLAPIFGEIVARLFAGFSDAEVAEFESSLQRMVENLGKRGGTAGSATT